MINNNVIIVFDYETSGLSWREDEPVQIAALAIDPRSLDIIPDSRFESLIKPVQLLTGSEAEIKAKWDKSYKAWEVNKKTRTQLENAPLPQHVLKAFGNYVERYKVSGWSGKPIPAGHNIQGFDLYWLDEMCFRHKMFVDKHGKQQLFNTRTVLDTLNFCFAWFEDMPEPEKFNMDYLREWLGISAEGAHDAMNDVEATARLLISFLKLHRRFAPKIKFKGAYR